MYIFSPFIFFFFFSSRRRHTRCSRDWSSDVCSSDLYALTTTATGLNPATSSGFTITPGAATQLVFGTQPGTTVAGQEITPAGRERDRESGGEGKNGGLGGWRIILKKNNK